MLIFCECYEQIYNKISQTFSAFSRKRKKGLRHLGANEQKTVGVQNSALLPICNLIWRKSRLKTYGFLHFYWVFCSISVSSLTVLYSFAAQELLASCASHFLAFAKSPQEQSTLARLKASFQTCFTWLSAEDFRSKSLCPGFESLRIRRNLKIPLIFSLLLSL